MHQQLILLLTGSNAVSAVPQRFSGESLDLVGSDNGYRSHIGFLLWGIILLTLLLFTLLGGWTHMALWSTGARRAMWFFCVVACTGTTMVTSNGLVAARSC
jgi:hypothetical protein